MSDLLTYSLKHPVAFTPSRTVTEISFRADLKVRDLKRLDPSVGGFALSARLFAILSNEPQELIDALSGDDFLGILELLSPFVGKFLSIGVRR
jgi:hypothetical protein